MINIGEIAFPANQGYRYYKIHYQYVLDSIKAAGISVRVTPDMKQIGGAEFEVQIDGKRAVIDFFNFTEIHPDRAQYLYYFKFHYTQGLHEPYANMHPFGTISFYDWGEYKRIREQVNYQAKGDLVLNNQRPYGNAVQRRKKIQAELLNRYGRHLDGSLTNQQDFWQKINDCLVSVCVPGARNDILDRGQFQYMALGCCTISPKLPTLLPFRKPLIPGTHYIACQDDYGDLNDQIEWCRNNREACVEIGRNAQQLFEETSTPQQLWTWVSQVVNA